MISWKRSIVLMVSLLLMTVQGAWAQPAEYITDVMVVGGEKPNDMVKNYVSQGWTLIDYDLNCKEAGINIYFQKENLNIFMEDGCT